MLKENFIATTAISSFNNAALYAPFFAAVGLLTLPLLWIVYLYAPNFMSKFNWNNLNLDNQVGFFSSLFLAVWLMLFGGNHAVIRDGISFVPVLTGLVLFVLMAIIVQKSIQLGYMAKIKSKKIRLLMFVVVLLMAGASGYGTLWGVLLQLSAVLCGIIVGFCLRKNISLVPVNVLLMIILTILILMQPEFFRFGQLGNLTFVHLLAIVITGFFAVTALVTRYVRPRAKIHESAYVKLKWLFRIVSLLALVLFILTESVPIFIGLIASIGLLEMLSVYHAKTIFTDIYKQSFADLLICIGTIMICPAVSGVGVLYLASVSGKAKVSEFLGLL